MKRKKNKTIYFLGAGFSTEAGAPSQASIMKLIDEFDTEMYIERYHFMYEKSLNQRLPEQVKSVKAFIEKLTLLSPNIDLEDIYTPIDRSIISGSSFKGYSPEQLRNIRESLNALIGLIIDKSFENGNNQYVNDFANYIVNKNRETKEGDLAVVFTTNWDIILDNFIFQKRHSSGNNDVIDYGCHYTNYNAGDNYPPALIAKANGNHSHKILKLNGSLNWLKCSGCNRIQVSFQEKVALRHYYDNTECRFCGTKHMIPEMLMPTFLKQNDDTQLKNTWDQAGIELLETEKIVFMGYSLPMADFEIRQLLSRFLDANVKIEVVLAKSSNPEEYFKLDNAIKEKIVYNLPSSRYSRFFAKNKPTFFYEGVVNYINQINK